MWDAYRAPYSDCSSSRSLFVLLHDCAIYWSWRVLQQQTCNSLLVTWTRNFPPTHTLPLVFYPTSPQLSLLSTLSGEKQQFKIPPRGTFDRISSTHPPLHFLSFWTPWGWVQCVAGPSLSFMGCDVRSHSAGCRWLGNCCRLSPSLYSPPGAVFCCINHPPSPDPSLHWLIELLSSPPHRCRLQSLITAQVFIVCCSDGA